ncbi:ABC transporter permease subunit [uncultured Roseobacter sp.]|uniref:ABC transporter permease n=1 Tax=uncultured Roseobacter sp. TaxID=114847 RepID=UPI002610444D|nr:ABC transporter permease subunit [uncultured Roseobacter sp.]
MTSIETPSALEPEVVALKPPKIAPSFNTLLLWALICIFCVVPFLLVLAISFGQKIEGAAWEWAFTGENYIRFFVGADWPQSTTFLYLNRLWYSLYYAVIASCIAVITAFPFTYFMTRMSRAAQSRWLVFLLATMSLSEVFIVMGWDILLSNRSGLPMLLRETGVTAWLKDVGWFTQLREWGLANPRDVKFKTSEFATILTMSYLVWPYAVILLYPALSRLDQSMVEAARTMGAGPWTVVRTVVLPTVRMPLIGTLFLLFVFLLGTYVSVTVFADPSKQTLAISVYEAVRGSTLNAPFGAAQAMILLVTGAVCLLLGQQLVNRTGARA